MLHELAHALDYALHGFLSGHSPSFRECCRMLGLDPGFEKSRVRLSAAERNGRKDRIRKLLALSSSPFENEASEAIRKAKALMAKEGIDCSGKRAVKMKKEDYGRFDYILAMEKYNIDRILRITGGDPEEKIHLLLDFTERKGEISDPWYTGDFDTAYDDILEGLKGFLAFVKGEKR